MLPTRQGQPGRAQHSQTAEVPLWTPRGVSLLSESQFTRSAAQTLGEGLAPVGAGVAATGRAFASGSSGDGHE